jgi:hypothetical protein
VSYFGADRVDGRDIDFCVYGGNRRRRRRPRRPEGQNNDTAAVPSTSGSIAAQSS